jgi:hypothetical protein
MIVRTTAWEGGYARVTRVEGDMIKGWPEAPPTASIFMMLFGLQVF